MAVTRVGKGKSSKNENLIRWVKEVLAASDYKSFREWSKDSDVHSHAASDIEKGLNPRADTVADLARVAGLDVIEALIAHGCLRADEVPGDLSEREWLFVSGLRRLPEVQQDFVFDSIELQLKRNTDRESTALAQDTPQEA